MPKKWKVYGEYQKAPFFFSTRRIVKLALIFIACGELQKTYIFSFRLRWIRHKDANLFFFAYGERNGRNQQKKPAAKKCWAPEIACCAKGNQPWGGCFVKRLFWPKCCASAAAQQLVNALDTVYPWNDNPLGKTTTDNQMTASGISDTSPMIPSIHVCIVCLLTTRPSMQYAVHNRAA